MIAHQLQTAKERLGNELEDNLGVGFAIKGQLDRDPVIIDQILSLDPKNIWLSTDERVDMTPFVSLFLREDNYRNSRVNIFVQVSSPKMALQAAKLGSHVVVLRGREAGGIISDDGSHRLPLNELITDTLALFKTVDQAERPILLAAGGISSGYDLKSILDKGCDGAALGTVLALSEESCLTSEEKVEIMMNNAPSSKIASFDKRIEKKTPDGNTIYFSFLSKRLDTIKTTKQIVNEITNDCISMQVLST